MKNYDIIIIGGGVAGNNAALDFIEAGKRVAVIENDQWGGTCPNRGCDPKKILLSAVEAQRHSAQMVGKGIEKAPVINWPDLIEYKNSYTAPVSESTKNNLIDAGVSIYEGTGEFIDESSIQVNKEQLSADQFIIATGARPSILDIEGKEHLLTSRDFLDLPEMPETVTFIGGGYISFEFAAMAQAAGAKVHLIHHNDRPLKAYDKELVNDLMEQFEMLDITIHLNIDSQAIEENKKGLVIKGKDGFELNTDIVIGATGRLPNIEELKLDRAAVDYDKKGILVNKNLQTSNSNIYAMGDVLSKKQPKLTSVAGIESDYLVSLLTEKSKAKINYPAIPTIVFSTPKMAQVGVKSVEAEENPDQYKISTIDATEWFSYMRVNEPISIIKIIQKKENGQLVGASVLNNQADPLINLFSIFINKKMKAEEISDIGWAYPSLASDLPYFYQ